MEILDRWEWMLDMTNNWSLGFTIFVHLRSD